MSKHGQRHTQDQVERYLRRLSRWAPRTCRHDLVMEARRHLYEATCRAERAGLSHELAQHAAIQAFGPAWRIGLAARGLDDHPLLYAIRHLSRRAGGVGSLRLMRRRWRPRRRPRSHIF